ncbi:hypothetical protein JZU48_05090, partial [bacterium]|nr:hypothetical protein [bacterium]
MSEADKKKRGGAESADAGDRGANVKPFPDFIIPAPGVNADSSLNSGGQASSPTPASAGVPTNAPPGRQKPRGGGGWAFLFALVSLTAAGVSLSSPSLRPIAAEKLKQQFGDQYWIGVVTGTADTRPPTVIELDLKQFDARL